MKIVDSISQKLVNYIYKTILTKKTESINSYEKIYAYFKAYSILILSTFTIGLIISNFTSYLLITAILPNKITNSKTKYANYNNNNKQTSYSAMQKNIMARNIFNNSGEIPYEDTPEGSESFILKNFDKVPCAQTEKLPVQLVGIIYTGNPETNLVSIKDPQASIADVYKVGQPIIDNETYILYKVASPVSIEVRHDKKKICVSLNPQNYNTSNVPAAAQDSENISLENSFVTEQLGPGFSKILNSARLVPQIIDGKTTGFRIFAIAKDSLFDKIQLMNGDVIKNVNGINLEDSSQGFKIYEAFQDENNITLQIQRNNETLTKKVSVQ